MGHLDGTVETTQQLGVVIPVVKGPYQSNGASPWYAQLSVGTPGQALKFSLDTGSNFNWVTSSLCRSKGCAHYGRGRFDYRRSDSFSKIYWDSQSEPHWKSLRVDFGPWGDMWVKAGHDALSLQDADSAVFCDIYLSEYYTGAQFAQLDWDGGIGVPSYSYQPLTEAATFSGVRGVHFSDPDQQPQFHFMETLINCGLVSRDAPFVAFESDQASKRGQITLGKLDWRYSQSREYLFLPWQRYRIADLYYIWTSKVAQVSIGEHLLFAQQPDKNDCWLSLDSGSSEFKGDQEIMSQAWQYALQEGSELVIELPDDCHSRIRVPADIYNVTIEAGPNQGQTQPQFNPKLPGLDDLVLVGSVIMDHLYTVYEYRSVNSGNGDKLEPVGIWLFNKPHGPKLIDTKQTKTAAIFERGASL
ncbi:pepsin-like aspartyl protease [Aliagarivorans marinus]|uniref:pepsin-like aspartyl protease n=1 Tax=Aliagarivorans marinus TaxID=561965 RepID=UPI0003FA962F|nr:pepsin-like aspartyl protease [Aliagarivorans marinus]